MLAGSEDVTAWLWNADTAQCMAVLSGHSGAVTCGDFTPDGKSYLHFGIINLNDIFICSMMNI